MSDEEIVENIIMNNNAYRDRWRIFKDLIKYFNSQVMFCNNILLWSCCKKVHKIFEKECILQRIVAGLQEWKNLSRVNGLIEEVHFCQRNSLSNFRASLKNQSNSNQSYQKHLLFYITYLHFLFILPMLELNVNIQITFLNNPWLSFYVLVIYLIYNIENIVP